MLAVGGLGDMGVTATSTAGDGCLRRRLAVLRAGYLDPIPGGRPRHPGDRASMIFATGRDFDRRLSRPSSAGRAVGIQATIVHAGLALARRLAALTACWAGNQCFLVNVPWAGGAGAGLAARRPADAPTGRRDRFDLGGARRLRAPRLRTRLICSARTQATPGHSPADDNWPTMRREARSPARGR